MTDRCSHCGKQGATGVELKRCSKCKQASYCGAECQKGGWKGHKKVCALKLPTKDIFAKVNAAMEAENWRGVLEWEGRMADLMDRQPDAGREKIQKAFAKARRNDTAEKINAACTERDWRAMLKWEGNMEDMMSDRTDDECERVLCLFSWAHMQAFSSTGSKEHALSCVGMDERRIPILGRLQRFRDQGERMVQCGDHLFFLGRDEQAATWFQRARDVGAAHGFFSLESTACKGLGRAAVVGGRLEEGVELLRNALVAADLNELDSMELGQGALQFLIQALFRTNRIDEVEPLVLRYRETAKVPKP